MIIKLLVNTDYLLIMEIANELKTVKWGKDEYNGWVLLGSPENTKVSHLDISSNKIKGSLVLTNLPNLQELNCSHNQITVIEGLELPKLQHLNCSSNKITTIEGLELPNLQQLSCSKNQITEIERLKLPNLQTLYCSRNQITEIEGLELPNLQTLYCSRNQITEIEGLNLSNLQILYCSENQITTIEGLQLPKLQILQCSFNQITEIEGLELLNLQDLDCSSNQITKIEGLDLPNLQVLNCSHNQITEIEKLELPKLQVLYCNNNQITTIEGFDLLNLQELDCSSNQIMEIEGLELPNLQIIDCDNNQITTLAFMLPNNLRNLWYHDNPVEYIAPNIQRFLNRSKTSQGVYNDSQNVHNHHVQECVRKSIARLIGLKPTIVNVRDYVVNDSVLTETVKQLLMEYMDDTTVHSVVQVTFEELLRCVLSVADTHVESSEIKRILNDEMVDSQCKCYTGRMSRLINCLNGYSDCVSIHISDSEQIGNIIHIEKLKLEEQNMYSVEKHREMVIVELESRNVSKEVISEWVGFIE
jgi:Leucine-rich repeat (LRR) protein